MRKIIPLSKRKKAEEEPLVKNEELETEEGEEETEAGEVSPPPKKSMKKTAKKELPPDEDEEEEEEEDEGEEEEEEGEEEEEEEDEGEEEEEEEDEGEEEEEEEEDEPPPPPKKSKKAAPAKSKKTAPAKSKKTAKKELPSDNENEEEDESPPPPAKKKAAPAKSKKTAPPAEGTKKRKVRFVQERRRPSKTASIPVDFGDETPVDVEFSGELPEDRGGFLKRTALKSFFNSVIESKIRSAIEAATEAASLKASASNGAVEVSFDDVIRLATGDDGIFEGFEACLNAVSKLYAFKIGDHHFKLRYEPPTVIRANLSSTKDKEVRGVDRPAVFRGPGWRMKVSTAVEPGQCFKGQLDDDDNFVPFKSAAKAYNAFVKTLPDEEDED